MSDLSCLPEKNDIYNLILDNNIIEIFLANEKNVRVVKAESYNDEILAILSNSTYMCDVIVKTSKYNKYISTISIYNYTIKLKNFEEIITCAGLPIRTENLFCYMESVDFNLGEACDLLEILPQISNAKRITLQFDNYKLDNEFINFAHDNEWQHTEYSFSFNRIEKTIN